MNRTAQSFSDKWRNNRDLAWAATLREGSEIQRWILRRNGWADLATLAAFLAPRRRVLDAGCGNGRVTALLREHSDPARCEVVGVDLVAAPVAAENLRGYANVTVRQADLLGSLDGLGRFDFIYCQEVLHHTADPERAFGNLVEGCLADGGTIAIYVYREKAPVREFVDDYVRDRIKDLPYAEAMAVCEQITRFGRALAELDAEVEVPAVDVLGIEAGTYPVQRLMYHFFLKCFWNDELDFCANVAINYDWYHPEQCMRYPVGEIRAWFARRGLAVTHECVDPYGITMHAVKA
jgi:SAM-dependent methyltransferase